MKTDLLNMTNGRNTEIEIEIEKKTQCFKEEIEVRYLLLRTSVKFYNRKHLQQLNIFYSKFKKPIGNKY